MEKYKKLILTSIIISIIATVLVLYFTISEETFQALSKVRIEFLFLAILMHLTSFFIWALRIKVLAKTLGFRVDLRRSLEMVVSSVFTAAITPSHAGGEPVRIALLTRCGISPGDSSAIVLGERVMDGIFLAFIALLGLFVLQSYLEGHEYLRAVTVFSILIILGGIIFLIISLANPQAPEKTKRIILRISESFEFLRKREMLLEKIFEELMNFRAAMINFARRRNHGTYYAFILTALFWTNEFLIPLGLQEAPQVWFCYFVQGVLTLILMLPLTPGSSGIAELGAATFYSVILPSYKLGIFVIVWRFTIYHLNLILGLFMTMKVLRDVKRERKKFLKLPEGVEKQKSDYDKK
jgi:hypothetical protein